MLLEQSLVVWDGKSADDIAEVYRRHSNVLGFVKGLIRLLMNVPYQKGAS